jgi:hypothetical protein
MTGLRVIALAGLQVAGARLLLDDIPGKTARPP